MPTTWLCGRPRGLVQRPDHGVERIGDADDEGVGRVLLDALADRLHHLEVDAEQVVAAHAGLARHAGGDDARRRRRRSPRSRWRRSCRRRSPRPGRLCTMSSALPCGMPSTMSNRTTSPSSLRPTRWASVPPIWPAPISAILERAMSGNTSDAGDKGEDAAALRHRPFPACRSSHRRRSTRSCMISSCNLLDLGQPLPLPVDEVVHLLVQVADLELGLEVDPVVVLRAQPVLRLLPLLAHHDDRRLHRGQAGEHQVEQDERIGIERRLRRGPDVERDTASETMPCTAVESRNGAPGATRNTQTASRPSCDHAGSARRRGSWRSRGRHRERLRKCVAMIFRLGEFGQHLDLAGNRGNRRRARNRRSCHRCVIHVTRSSAVEPCR